MCIRYFVFPAYAGVFPYTGKAVTEAASLPRIRGGVSYRPVGSGCWHRSSPHTRGCFSDFAGAAESQMVFPAYAGVFLVVSDIENNMTGLPRIRGGVSESWELTDGKD